MITHPQVPGQCTRLSARGARRAPRAPCHLDRRGGARRGRRGTADRAAPSVPRWPREIYGGTVAAGGRGGSRRQRDALRVAGARAEDAAHVRAAAARAPAESGRPRSSSGAWRGATRLARAMPGRVRTPRASTSRKIESRPRRERLGELHVLRRSRGPRRHEAPVAAAIDGLREHCEEVRVLGSYPAARARERRAA